MMKAMRRQGDGDGNSGVQAAGGTWRQGGHAAWCGLCILFIFHLASGVAPRQRCTMFTFQPQRTLVQTQSESTQWGRPRIQRSQRSSKPSNAPSRATSLPLSATLQSCVSSMKTFTCIDMQPESVCAAQRWQCKQASSDGNGGKSKQSGECQMPATSATPTLLRKGACWANQRANRAQITNWNSRWGTANGRHTQNTLPEQEQKRRSMRKKWSNLNESRLAVA